MGAEEKKFVFNLLKYYVALCILVCVSIATVASVAIFAMNNQSKHLAEQDYLKWETYMNADYDYPEMELNQNQTIKGE